MTSRPIALTIDAVDVPRLAHFWATALHWSIAEVSADVTTLGPTDGTPITVDIARVPHVKGDWQNNIHLDLTTTSWDDQAESVAQLVALGARHIDIGQRPEETHVVLADPEGNELCILEPTNRFLSSCGRLGAINADGRRITGVFWSAVLDLPLVWDENEETALRIPGPTGPMITWSGPPLMAKYGKNRMHLDIAPVGVDQGTEVERLLALGATRVDIGQDDVPWVVLADPDGNEFCLLTPRPA